MQKNIIYCEDNIVTMGEHIDSNSIDVVLTSPFYNTNKKAGKGTTLGNTKANTKYYSHIRYDVFVDNLTDEQYADYCKGLFIAFGRILKYNGTVLWNVSYGGGNAECLFLTVARIIQETDFTIADVICWKKRNAMPNNVSKNKLTRIWEFIFVFCRKTEKESFYCNKKAVSKRENGQVMYDSIQNFIEARNNDEKCPYNKATFSTELVHKLLDIYCPKEGIVYDPFMGSGTTAVACKQAGINFIGSEISKNQCLWAENRLNF